MTLGLVSLTRQSVHQTQSLRPRSKRASTLTNPQGVNALPQKSIRFDYFCFGNQNAWCTRTAIQFKSFKGNLSYGQCC